VKIQGKVVAKIQQEGGAQIARIQVYKKKKTQACLMRVFDIADDGELNIGDQVTVEVLRTAVKVFEKMESPVFQCGDAGGAQIEAVRELYDANMPCKHPAYTEADERFLD
jgi:hypothetical protein